MTDYKAYKDEKGIANIDLISAISPEFKKFSKIHCSNINAPEKYGLCLLPEAEKLLVDKYGIGSGLAFYKKKKRSDKRKKQNRLYVRLDDSTYASVCSVMQELGYSTAQSFLEAVLTYIVKEAPEL